MSSGWNLWCSTPIHSVPATWSCHEFELTITTNTILRIITMLKVITERYGYVFQGFSWIAEWSCLALWPANDLSSCKLTKRPAFGWTVTYIIITIKGLLFITQHEGWYLFHLPTEGSRPSQPRHCRYGCGCGLCTKTPFKTINAACCSPPWQCSTLVCRVRSLASTYSVTSIERSIQNYFPQNASKRQEWFCASALRWRKSRNYFWSLWMTDSQVLT